MLKAPQFNKCYKTDKNWALCQVVNEDISGTCPTWPALNYLMYEKSRSSRWVIIKGTYKYNKHNLHCKSMYMCIVCENDGTNILTKSWNNSLMMIWKKVIFRNIKRFFMHTILFFMHFSHIVSFTSLKLVYLDLKLAWFIATLKSHSRPDIISGTIDVNGK